MNNTITSKHLNLPLCDGQACPAFHASSSESTTGIVLLHDCWGLSQHSIEIAENFAAAGYSVLLPDLYRNQHPSTQGEADGMMDALDWYAAAAYVVPAAQLYLAGSCSKVVVLGLSMGSGIALLAATMHEAIDAYALFYGLPPLLDLDFGNISAPIQGHFVAVEENDTWCPASRVNQFLSILKEQNQSIEMHWYHDATHGFMNHRKPEMYCASTCEIATQRTLSFFESL
ncbi:MAG: alpha/beta fold hydrolase [Pseudomonadota bacterium]